MKQKVSCMNHIYFITLLYIFKYVICFALDKEMKYISGMKSQATYIFTEVQQVEGTEPLRNLADQLTLFKPGRQIVPLTLLLVPQTPDSKLSTPLIYICTTYLHRYVLKICKLCTLVFPSNKPLKCCNLEERQIFEPLFFHHFLV